jgi:hypothetical protein
VEERRRRRGIEKQRLVGEIVKRGGVIQWNSPVSACCDSVTTNPVKGPIQFNQQSHEEGF